MPLNSNETADSLITTRVLLKNFPFVDKQLTVHSIQPILFRFYQDQYSEGILNTFYGLKELLTEASPSLDSVDVE